MTKVGEKLRELRTRRALSLRELAVRAGVSHSALSLIERNQMSPSLDTLSAVLDALGTTPVGFFLDLQSDLGYSPFYGRDELVEIRQDDRLSFRMVGAHHPNRQLLLMRETYRPGADTGETTIAHTGQEGGVVISGEVEVTVAGRARVLTAGEAYYFDSQAPHRFRNLSGQDAEIISALTPPTY